MTRMFICLVMFSLVSGCLLAPPIQRIPFPVSEYDKLSKKGTASVQGQVFMKTRSGDVKLGAGNEAFLNPVTTYSFQWYKQTYQQGKVLSAPDPRYDGYMITTITDAQGKFKLRNVPPGEYFLVSSVFWEDRSDELQGGYIAKWIRVEDGIAYECILTR